MGSTEALEGFCRLLSWARLRSRWCLKSISVSCRKKRPVGNNTPYNEGRYVNTAGSSNPLDRTIRAAAVNINRKPAHRTPAACSIIPNDLLNGLLVQITWIGEWEICLNLVRSRCCQLAKWRSASRPTQNEYQQTGPDRSLLAIWTTPWGIT